MSLKAMKILHLVIADQTKYKADIPNDNWTDGRTKTSSYRDARTHLKLKFLHLPRKL